ncbi:MAG TPA: alpha/beta hydrolase [Burkholderiales bacterium]|jgi:pimeloyl-ACP methyl ester carboxylesterase|nr:alpha/beta hydrolase [Burkholderiales bacterium]
MHTKLVSIPTDTLPLEGAYYEPDGAASGAVLLFHGNTMNFYVGAPRFLPPVLTRLGLACLAFNRRGHDIMSTFNSRIAVGGAYQSTAEAIADNRIAAEWLAARGFPDPVVIGHSNGGMLGVRHVVDHPRTPALVLLSAGRGGVRTVSGGPEKLFAGERQEELTAHARWLVEAGRGRELMFMPGWWYVITAESFLDRIVSVPDTLALAPQVKCPVLTLRGDQEDGHRYPAEEFQKVAGGPCKAEIVPDCDHFYNGKEEKVAGIVSDWLVKTLGLSPEIPSPRLHGEREAGGQRASS